MKRLSRRQVLGGAVATAAAATLGAPAVHAQKGRRTYWLAADVVSPAVHFGLSGAGSNAWFGWPDVPQLEKLTTDWVRAADQAKRKQLADEIQRVALDEVAYVPWGEWSLPTAFRKNVQDVPNFAAPVFWNVKIT